MKLSSKLTKALTLSGVIGPVLIGLTMLITALAYTGSRGEAYNPLNHFVSELGEAANSELHAVFNLGLIIGGGFLVIFMILLAGQIQSWLRWPLGLVGILTALSGLLVGCFPMDNLGPHLNAAMSFFNLGMLISFLYSLVFLFSKTHTFPKWLAVPGLLNAAFFLLFLNFPGSEEINAEGLDALGQFHATMSNRPDVLPLAVVEWLVVAGILTWMLMLGIYLVKHQKPEQ